MTGYVWFVTGLAAGVVLGLLGLAALLIWLDMRDLR